MPGSMRWNNINGSSTLFRMLWFPSSASRASLLGFAEAGGASCLMLPAPRNHWMPARWVCHLHLSQMPVAARKIYRERVDAQALKRFQQAKVSADDGQLKGLLADFFCSTASKDAILLLASRAFERAQFERRKITGRCSIRFGMLHQCRLRS